MGSAHEKDPPLPARSVKGASLMKARVATLICHSSYA